MASGERQVTAEYRISKGYKILNACFTFVLKDSHDTLIFVSSAWLKDSSHAVIGKLDWRISMVTGLTVNHPFGEYLQVVNYGIGGHYEPHFDHATVSI